MDIKSIGKGAALHVKVVECTAMEYEVLVLNEYGSKDRLVDYSILAKLFRNLQLEAMHGILKRTDLLRATVFGNVKNEQHAPARLLTLNPNFLADEHKSIKLGRISKKDIPFYPEDVSKFNNFADYIKARRSFDGFSKSANQMQALGIDPFKVYSFHEPSDGKILGRERIPASKTRALRLDASVEAIKKAEDCLKNGAISDALSAVEEAFVAWPNNDVAYALRGKIYLQMANDMPSRNVGKACRDFEEALKLNPNNVMAGQQYSSVLIKSARKYGSVEKVREILCAVRKINSIPEAEELLKNLEIQGKEPMDESDTSYTSSDSRHSSLKTRLVDPEYDSS